MKNFIGKTQDEAIALACKELNVPVENLYYEVVDTKTGLFGKIKSVEISCYTDAMVIEFVQDYLKKVILCLGLNEVNLTPSYSDDLIRIKIVTDHNSILIGKNGRTLQSLNEIVRCAANNTFKKRVRILLDINDYKTEKYEKLISIAKREAGRVGKTRITAVLDPMSADERRVIHNALVSFKHIRTVSAGEGKNRHITIEYVD